MCVSGKMRYAAEKLCLFFKAQYCNLSLVVRSRRQGMNYFLCFEGSGIDIVNGNNHIIRKQLSLQRATLPDRVNRWPILASAHNHVKLARRSIVVSVGDATGASWYIILGRGLVLSKDAGAANGRDKVSKTPTLGATLHGLPGIRERLA